MTFSGYTDAQNVTTDRSSRNGARIDHIILHHSAATNVNTVLGLMRPGGRRVSSNYVVGNDGKVYGVVPEEYRAWTSGSTTDGGRGAAFDRRSITFEIINESAGGSWPVSAKAHEAVAQVVADVSKRYKFSLNRDSVLGHRELWTRYRASYPTACPGGLDMDWIVRRARQILGTGNTPGSISSGGGSGYVSGTEWGYSLKKVQYRVNQMGYSPKLDEDGIKGPKTEAGIRWAQGKLGVAVDGDWGKNTQKAYDKWSQGGKPASKPSGKKAPAFPLAKNEYFGPRYPLSNKKSVSGYYSHREDLRRWQKQMENRGWDFSRYGTDGLYGDETAENARAFQREKGLKVDGLIGPDTWREAWEAPIT